MEVKFSDGQSELLRQELMRDERMVCRPYRDSEGKLTIGVGRNLDDMGISKIEAEFMLSYDIERVVRELDAAIPWWRGHTEARQRVLANMAFNMGLPRFLGFKHMLAAMQAGKFEDAALEMLDSKWAEQVGDRATRLAYVMTVGV